jgi:hypothetical protein
MAPKFKLEVTYHRCQEKELLLLPFNPEVFLKQKTENRKRKTENTTNTKQQTPNNKHQTKNTKQKTFSITHKA